MARITFRDSLGEESFETHPPRGRGFVIFVIILSFVMGALGGIGGLIFLSSTSETFRSKLGLEPLKELAEVGKTEKVTVEESSAVIDVVKKVSPAVVSITSKRNIEDFFGRVISQEGGGTGFIITNDGLILTNKHVISDDNADYSVITNDGKTYEAKILAKDPFNDLAVVKIEATGLSVVDLGDSDKVEVGSRVIAIGNALGEFRNTVTTGVLSARERTLTASDASGSGETLEGLLQTDAAINFGNSGGPLVNIRGQVIGINTAVADKGVAEGIGFAIPINTAKSAIESVQKSGKISRPYLGIRYVFLNKELAKLNNLPSEKGALIMGSGNQVGVLPGSPAAKAGIKEKDIILKIEGQEIDEDHSIARVLQRYQPGDEVTLEVLRDKNKFEAKLTLGEISK